MPAKITCARAAHTKWQASGFFGRLYSTIKSLTSRSTGEAVDFKSSGYAKKCPNSELKPSMNLFEIETHALKKSCYKIYSI